MTNSVHQKPKTSVELFQTGNDKTHRKLTQKLEILLGDESPRFGFSDEYQHLTLQEFQENFEWEVSYSVVTNWNLEVGPISYETELECEDKEECLSFINGDQVMEEPDSYEVLENSEHDLFLEVGGRSLKVEVTKLRLKSKEPSLEKL